MFSPRDDPRRMHKIKRAVIEIEFDGQSGASVHSFDVRSTKEFRLDQIPDAIATLVRERIKHFAHDAVESAATELKAKGSEVESLKARIAELEALAFQEPAPPAVEEKPEAVAPQKPGKSSRSKGDSK